MNGRAAIMDWAPALVLGAGTLLTVGLDRQERMPLRDDLANTIPQEVAGFSGADVVLSEAEIRVAGVTDYLFREFTRAGGDDGFSLYVGYYDSQTQGRTIHSPKNCLPGAGWEALQSRRVAFQTSVGEVNVNRYLLQRGEQRALVVYWYQGRGRVEANEYMVKAHLLRDAALSGRTEEALVRIVVPIDSSEDEAFDLAVRAARDIVPAVFQALPT